MVIGTEHSVFEKIADVALLPAMVHKTLIGAECYDVCTTDCETLHICDPDNCMLFCSFKQKVSAGEIPFIDKNEKKRKTHTCGEDLCEMTCHFQGMLKKQCGRIDPHDCTTKNDCNITCLNHHSIDDYGTCPGVVHCSILPPQNCRFPILRVTLKTANGEEKLVAPLCRTCAETLDPFKDGEKKCNHSKKQRLLSGTFTLGEVAFAIKEQKYEMVKIYQVFYYPRYQV